MTTPAGQALPAPFAWEDLGQLRLLAANMRSARAFFSTRAGGVSKSPYDSLNLGDHVGDKRAHVTENRRRLFAVLGRGAGTVVWARQVHGATLESHDRPAGRDFAQGGDDLPEADGQIARSSSPTPLVLVADCLPVVIATGSALAVLHCGWRGVEAGIVGKAVGELGAEVLDVAIGPGIGPCCYEVGDEVVEAFTGRGHQVTRMLDLPAIVEAELVGAGVEGDRISDCGLCTSCNPELFFSHRRDGERTGRQAGIAWLSS